MDGTAEKTWVLRYLWEHALYLTPGSDWKDVRKHLAHEGEDENALIRTGLVVKSTDRKRTGAIPEFPGKP